MIKTGNPFTDFLFTAIVFLPLIPVLLIIGRKLYLEEPLNFLAIICLLGFLETISDAYPLVRTDQHILHKVFVVLQFLLLVQAFRTNLGSKVQYGLTILLTALLSIALTYWSVKGWGLGSPESDVLFNLFLAGVIGVSGPAVIRTHQLQIFRSPLFWMEAGTLFYISLSLMLLWIGPCCQILDGPQDPEKRLLLVLADAVRYLLYITAVLSFTRSRNVL
jgi:hypothetical protein